MTEENQSLVGPVCRPASTEASEHEEQEDNRLEQASGTDPQLPSLPRDTEIDDAYSMRHREIQWWKCDVKNLKIHNK